MDEENKPVEFDADKMKRHILGDMFLLHVWCTSVKEGAYGPEDVALRVLFNTYVLGDSAAERAYREA